MGNLKYKKYQLIPNGFGSFDLFEEVIRTKKDSEETYKGVQNIGYGYSFDRALERIIQHIVDDKIEKEEITTIKGYIDTYRQEVDNLKQFINLNK